MHYNEKDQAEQRARLRKSMVSYYFLLSRYMILDKAKWVWILLF